MPAAAAASSPTAAKAPPPPPPPSTSPPLRVAFTRRGRAGHHRAFAPAVTAPPPKTRWSWLHATACSCAVVAAGAYAHAALSAHVDTALDRLLASLAATRIVLPWRSLVVLTLLLAWGAALLVLRALGVHAPLRLALRLLSDRVASARVALAHRRHRSSHAAATLARAALSHGRRRRGLSTAEPEIDESDMLVVTALSAEPRRLSAPQRRASATASSLPASASAPSSTASSTSSRESSDTVDADDEQDAQILLHPREGATGGRHQSNHIIVDDPYVSRFHFKIGYDALEKEYFLEDLGSTTGTFVFLKPDVPKRLSVDDRVRLGDSEFEVVAIDCNAATGTPFLRLQFTEGPLRGVGQTLGKTPVTLGRRSCNALCITDDTSISGRHSSIAYLGDGFYLTDLQSTNGTALRLSASGVPSARRFLLHGDVFGVGANRFLVEYAHELQLQEKQRALARDALGLVFDNQDDAAITAAAAAPAHS